MRDLRHLPNRAVDLVVGVFDGAERLHWRIVRARAGAFAPIAAAFARRFRAVRDGLAPPEADRIRIGVVPRVLAGAIGLVAIVAVSTALAPSSSGEAVPRPNVGVAAQKAPKSAARKRLARAPARLKAPRAALPAMVRVRTVSPRKDRVSATTTPPAVERRVVKRARVARVQRPNSPAAPVTTPLPPSPQPVSPAPQPPPAGETNDKPPGDDENSGPGGGNEDEENGGGKGKDEKDKDKDKDKDEDEDEDEDNEGQPQPPPPPPPPPNDEDDDRGP